MPKTIQIAGIEPVQITISLGDDGSVGLSVRYIRLDEQGVPIEGHSGILSRELEGGMKQKVLTFIRKSVKQWVREREEIPDV